MITVTPAEDGRFGSYKAYNSAGSVIAGFMSMNSHGTGEVRFVPNEGYDADHYQRFLEEDRKHEEAKSTDRQDT